MPGEANTARRHKDPRARDKVTNWPDPDKALQQRGSLTVWVSRPRRWRLASAPHRRAPPRHADVAIETGHLLRLAFGRRWRQIGGLLRSLVTVLGVGVPDHTTVSRRSPGLGLAASLAEAQASGPGRGG